MPATIRRAICSKAPRTRPSSAALPRPRPSLGRERRSRHARHHRSAAARARGRSTRRSRGSCAARAINPRFIAGQMRHGPRGAAELAETVDRLVDFAETTGAVPSALFDLVHDAYLADPSVRDFLLRENPAAARAIAERLEPARRHGALASAPQRSSARACGALQRGGGAMSAALRARRLSRACRRRCATGDGLLARLMPAGPIPLDAFDRALRRRRARHGNGIIEITARGSIQVRGLDAALGAAVRGRVAALGIELSETVPVLADPLAGDPQRCSMPSRSPPSCAGRIAEAAASRSRRRSRSSSTAAGASHLDALAADIRLRAIATSEGPRLQVALAGDAVDGDAARRRSRRDDAVDAVLGFARRAHRRDARRTRRAPPICCRRDRRRQRRSRRRGRAPSRSDCIRCEDGARRARRRRLPSAMRMPTRCKQLDPRSPTAHGARWARPAPGRALLLGRLRRDAAARSLSRAAQRARLHRRRRTIRAAASSPVAGAPSARPG